MLLASIDTDQLVDKAIHTGVNENGNTDLGTLIQKIIKAIISITIVIAVIYMIIMGIKFITAGGDSSKAEAAQKGITFAIIGIVVALAASVLTNFVVQYLTGGQ